MQAILIISLEPYKIVFQSSQSFAWNLINKECVGGLRRK